MEQLIKIYLKHAYFAGKQGSPEEWLNDLADDFLKEVANFPNP